MAEEPGEGQRGDEQGAEQSIKEKQQKMQESLEQRERQLAPRPSFWPLLLALALVVTFIGVMTLPAILIAGAFLVIVALIGWVMEKQEMNS